MPDSSFQSSGLPPFQSSDNRLFDEPFLRKLERLALLSRRAMAGQLQGERRSPKRGQSVEFADFRPYAPGDDFRRIDWNAYARLERFFIKLFVKEEDLTVHLLVDTSRSMDWGEPNKLWYAARAAGALGYVALAGLDRVTVTAMGNGGKDGSSFFPPRRGKQQAMSLFGFLHSLARSSNDPAPQRPNHPIPQPPNDLTTHLHAYAAAARSPGPLLLFSDLMDDGWADGLNAARPFPGRCQPRGVGLAQRGAIGRCQIAGRGNGRRGRDYGRFRDVAALPRGPGGLAGGITPLLRRAGYALCAGRDVDPL